MRATIRALLIAQEWNPNTKDYQFTTPTLLLLGSESTWGKQATENATALIRDSRVAILQGQGHRATATAPELVASELAAFLGK